MDHVYRRNKNAFLKNRIECSQPLSILSGDDVWEEVAYFPKVTREVQFSCHGCGVAHNWIRKNIFWKLPYWNSNLLRYNLDVMHIEKTVFDNVFNTVMDIKDKTKDDIKARMDLKKYCRRKELELQHLTNGKVLKPKANFVLSKEQKIIVFK